MVLPISVLDKLFAGPKKQGNPVKSVSIALGLFLAAPLTLAVTTQSRVLAQSLPEYYIGVDSRVTVTSGVFTGLPNPNYNRLTFLFAHREENPLTNHFHGIGAYSYSGLASNPIINSTNTNNRIPESYTGLPPLTLTPGEGIFQNRFISAPSSEEYSNLLMQPVAVINQSTDIGEQTLFNSSGNRWSNPLGNAVIALQLVSISEGLNIANNLGVNILPNIGDTYTIGSGDNFSFLPTFFATRPGRYSAELRLLDVGGTQGRTALGESGTFNIDFQTVPEPSTLAGLGVFGAILLLRARRKQ